MGSAGDAAKREWSGWPWPSARRSPLPVRPGPPRASGAASTSPSIPTPELAPQGGFTLDRALVYALVRQESKFDPDASSVSGAYGLMQLTPATRRPRRRRRQAEEEPAAPARPGAATFVSARTMSTRLLAWSAATCCTRWPPTTPGPGVIQKTLAQLGSNGDSLLAIESMPGGQTRDFVETRGGRLLDLPQPVRPDFADPLAAAGSEGQAPRPRRWIAGARLTRLSLVAIARDEAPRIGRALLSAPPACRPDDRPGHRLDDDETIEMAEAAGAETHRFAWCDDFSVARNAALALSDADWNLVLDADEWIDGPAEGAGP